MSARAAVVFIWAAAASIMGANAADCTLGSEVEPTAAFPGQSGQFLDLQHLVPCRGNITAWHYCYYTSEIANPSAAHLVFLRVWRPRNPNSWSLVYNVPLEVVPESGPQVICNDFIPGEDQHFVAERGDILGVYLPVLTESLPIVAERVPLSELHMDTRNSLQQFSSGSIQANQLREISSLALSLYADIEQPTTVSGPRPEPIPSSQLTSDTNGTSSDGSSGGGGNSGGAIAAGVLVPLLVVAAAVTVAGVLLFIYFKRKATGGEEAKSNGVIGIDNINYVGSDSVEVSVQLHPNAQTASNTYGNSRPSKPDRMAYSTYAIPRPLNSILPNPNDSAASSSGPPAGKDTYVMLHSGGSTDPALNGIQPSYQDCAVFEEDLDQEEEMQIGSASVEYHRMLREHLEDMDSLDENVYATPPCEEDEIYRVLYRQKILRIPSDQITLRERLGSRHGTVQAGLWRSDHRLVSVALKMAAAEDSQECRVRLLQEAVIMGQFTHPNIVQLCGVVTDGDRLMVVMEHLKKGDLKKCLSKLRPDHGELVPACTAKVLLSYSQQVAFAMYYLASKGFVHRDLAARNIFVSRENICKVGDFGMSRDLADESYLITYRSKIPLKWTAPEAIHCRKYSTSSDVWSYGCVLYEIWSLGQKLFSNDTNPEVIKKVDAGVRLPPPPGCPKAIYRLMLKCWHPAPMSRPSFRDILAILLEDEAKILEIPTEDASTNPQASMLGSDLQAGEQMYLSLQQMYLPNQSHKDDPDYEYVVHNSSEHQDESQV